MVENDGFSMAKRGHGPLKKLMQVRFFFCLVEECRYMGYHFMLKSPSHITYIFVVI